jgi:hypothetical protein
MKNRFKSSYLFLFFALIILNSCQKDIDIITPLDSESYMTSIFGTIIDKDANPLADAQVIYNDQVVQSDEYGTYLFKDVLVDSRYNHITIEKDGYFINTRTFRGTKSKMILLKAKMLSSVFNYKINSNQASALTHELATITFDGNGMVFKDDGVVYSGDVDVAIQYLNPTNPEIGELMPGDLSAINGNNELQLLESFGMIGVELLATNGKRLQLSSESKATISVNIPETLLSIAPNEIPLWHFDHDLGLWVEEGKAIKSGNKYFGEVSHFSFWNFDLNRSPVLISGRLIDQDGIGIGATQIKIFRDNESRGATGYSDYDGYFDGPIEKGEELKLTITLQCDGEEIVYNTQIGPFEEDSDLGDITFEIMDREQLSVKGSFIDCDGEIMQDGLLKINDQGRPEYFPILEGRIDKVFGFCGLDEIELEVIDRNTLLKTTLGDFDIPGSIDLDEIKVCEEAVNFATISSQTYDIDLVLVDSVSFTVNGSSKSILAFDYSFDVGVIEIKYVDQDNQGIELGTHNILKMVFNYMPDSNAEEIVLILDTGEITIEEVDVDARTVKGSYLFDAEIDGPDEKHTFEGSFFSSY